ncbi:MAG TPA: NAD+ synthase [Dehalococcoidia bacterium]|jgi:NAD+ synthase (glutamine-hydrolysing)|nr:NAD+ synthase [Dehalococcoidia bacterium]|tara:strand:+ start:390 stop:2096 length:1707 start_codon:yes stop_codon:yes gene_type:complete
MSRLIRVALAQINPIVGDVRGNVEKISSIITQAKIKSVDLLAFPELCITGYPPEDLLKKQQFVNQNKNALDTIIQKTEEICVVVGFVDGKTPLYNAAAVLQNQSVIGTYHKEKLPNYGVFDEQRYFEAGQLNQIFNIKDINIGINICEDIWYADGPIKKQKSLGAELIININASPYHIDKKSERSSMLKERALANDLTIAYVNSVGGQDELVFDGNSFIVAPDGNVIAGCSSFKEELMIADLQFRDDADLLEEVNLIEYFNIDENIYNSVNDLKQNMPTILDDLEEIYQALVVGTRDYIMKSGFSKALIGLSGGIDSSLTAAIAVDALGKDNVIGITMPSRYSSEGSVTDSEILAGNLGITLLNIPIEDAHKSFERMLNDVFIGSEQNIAEENVQSRIRGNILMTVSNKFGWIVLTTGNKSEMSMGYATLYGDMAGGFCVIKDVSKTMVYELSRWKNKQLEFDLIPNAVINKPPSAELKPNQFDEDSLPPYHILDEIIELYLENDSSYEDLIERNFPKEMINQVVDAIHRNEYKRNQSPPGVKITPRAYGKDWRMPIVSKYKNIIHHE